MRPLSGGFEAWRDGGYPVEAVFLASGEPSVNTLTGFEAPDD